MRLSRKAARWTVPVGAVAVTGAAIASGVMPSTAGAAPVLPARTPAQLLADVSGTHKLPPLTGTVVETTSLGLPQLPQAGNPTSLSSLLTGSHTVKVYWQDAKHFRLSVPQSMSETDIIRNGSTAWLWESNQNTVTKFTASPDAGKKMGKFKHAASEMPKPAALTPQQAADEVLAKVGKTTVVSTQSNVDVADQAAYQLVLAPKSAESTVGSVRIAVDGKTGVPLRLQVFAKGGKTPAFQVGYTSIDYTAPSSSNFSFTPPAGAKVTTPDEKSAKGGAKPQSANPLAGAKTTGTGWLSVAELPSSALTAAGNSTSGSSGTASASSPASASSSAAGSSPLSGSSQEMMSALFGSAKPVSGSWGHGQLLHTSLLNVLIANGKMYIGAVSPSVLEATAGH